VLLALSLTAVTAAQSPPEGWTKPFPAHRIVGNVYNVGTYDLSVFLITSPQGHILINTGIDGSAKLIEEGVESLGFKFSDIRILLEMQAHWDHVGELAKVKQTTGAKLHATRGDQRLLEHGDRFEPIKVDRIIADGDKVELGGVVLETVETPGHTQGSVSFTTTVEDGGRRYRLAIANMGSINTGTKLTNNSEYPSIAEDYALTFERQKKLEVDIWVAAHGSQYGLHDKYSPGDAHDPNRFVDPDGYRAAVERHETRFRELLAAENGR